MADNGIPTYAGATVLVVEDEAAIRGVVRATLRRAGYVVLEASDAALKALAKGARVRSLSKGQAFVHEGIVPDHFGIVLSGHVRAVHFGHDGRPVTISVVKLSISTTCWSRCRSPRSRAVRRLPWHGRFPSA